MTVLIRSTGAGAGGDHRGPVAHVVVVVGDDRTVGESNGLDATLGVSRPRELPPQPLSEPDVSLSAHPAPIIQQLENCSIFPVRKEIRVFPCQLC